MGWASIKVNQKAVLGATSGKIKETLVCTQAVSLLPCGGGQGSMDIGVLGDFRLSPNKSLKISINLYRSPHICHLPHSAPWKAGNEED